MYPAENADANLTVEARPPPSRSLFPDPSMWMPSLSDKYVDYESPWGTGIEKQEYLTIPEKFSWEFNVLRIRRLLSLSNSGIQQISNRASRKFVGNKFENALKSEVRKVSHDRDDKLN